MSNDFTWMFHTRQERAVEPDEMGEVLRGFASADRLLHVQDVFARRANELTFHLVKLLVELWEDGLAVEDKAAVFTAMAAINTITSLSATDEDPNTLIDGFGEVHHAALGYLVGEMREHPEEITSEKCTLRIMPIIEQFVELNNALCRDVLEELGLTDVDELKAKIEYHRGRR